MSFFGDIVKVADEVKKGVELAATDTAKAGEWLLSNQTLITGLAGLAGPAAATITTNALALYEKIATSVQAAGTAAAGNGLSVSLDQATINAVLADIAAAKAFKA